MDPDTAPSRTAIKVTVVSFGVLGILWYVTGIDDALHWRIAFLAAETVAISIVIWQACDPFADAAQWIGHKLRLPGSIRGATLDAVASSLPELFSGIFFVIVAISVASGTPDALAAAAGEGFAATVAICTGSAIYNMVLIPALCALVVASTRKSRPTIDLEAKVITRDGLWFGGCQLLLIIFLFQDEVYTWMALVLMALYLAYICRLYADARIYQRTLDVVRDRVGREGNVSNADAIAAALEDAGVRAAPMLVAQIKSEIQSSIASDGDNGDNDDDGADEETAGFFFGLFEVKLNRVTATMVIVISTIIAGAACWGLVAVTRATAHELGIPIFFVAVILAAAASSVPDTFLSIGASRRGDDDGAVSNAFGSNIFDICICLPIPLIINLYLNNWQPIRLLQDGEPLPGLIGVRILLCVLTVVTLAIMWHKRQLTRTKAYVLIALYAIFIAYAVAGSLDIKIMGFSL